jgi:hypothetical protein
MTQNKVGRSKPTVVFNQNNTVEGLKDPMSSLDQNNLLEELFGRKDSLTTEEKEKKLKTKPRQEFSLFNYNHYYEKEVVKKQIKELTEQIKKEIEFIKKSDRSLISEIQDVENLTINSLPEKPGIYHIRFLEIVLRILRSLREKVGESRTWLAALISKKKKRGSLFASLSKKKGTQYSMSQELSTARAVQ